MVLAACSTAPESRSTGDSRLVDGPGQTMTSSPDDDRQQGSPEVDDLSDTEREAIEYLELLDLPVQGIPSGFIEADRLFGECVASFGIAVLEPDLARESGVYYFEVGAQLERVNEVAAACEAAIGRLGIVTPPGDASNEARFDAYLDVHECLRENGYPTTDPPSRDSFVEDPESWTPWMGMIGSAGPILPTAAMVSGPLRDYFESQEACPRP